MNITLQAITGDNWRQAGRLKVRPDQTKFVASNLYSLVQANYEPFWVTKAIYHDGVMVGFTMYGCEESDEEWAGYWICRLMVDEAHQGKGYGRAALMAVLHEIRETGYHGKVFISFEPDNRIAETLYKSAGFFDTGKMLDDDEEKVFQLTIE